MTSAAAFDPDPILKTLPTGPGVYRMFGADGTVIYVGKARNLKRRVSSYFRKGAHNAKTQALVGQVADLQVTVTHTEAEALILENNLIKEHRPRYNVLLRDDKTYPYIHLSTAGLSAAFLSPWTAPRRGPVFRPVSVGRRGA